MFVISLKNYDSTRVQEPISVFNFIKGISKPLAKKAILAQVDNKLVDLNYLLTKDASVEVLDDTATESLTAIRHSTAHLLAQAVKQLYPKAQVTIGPVTDDGFYYDFAYEESFTEKDLIKIENRMRRIANKNLPIERFTMSRDTAIKFFTDLREDYKAQIIADIPADAEISCYKQGDFVDLCRGPHVPNTAKLKAFKLTKIAGAYWRGDSNNEMLQRIYGIAFANNKDLELHLIRLSEAVKRDHRKIAKLQELFHIQEEAPGMVFWHRNGWTLYKIVESFMRRVFLDNGYEEVHTPQIIDKKLWEKSGHWDKFGANMFITSSENRDYALKPMNCPAHVQIYNQKLKSYRDLPLRLAEFGSCHRNEPSGTLHGLMRARNFTQDDGHIFCTKEQIKKELINFIDLTFSIYKKFGFDNIIIKVSTRPEQRVGSDMMWDEAEKWLIDALSYKKIAFQIQEGEGAFYGPKIEFVLKDCLLREWQCGTLQVDFAMPERLGAKYIDSSGKKQIPVMLHRAIVGSLERFIGILIEHYAGAYPNWLAPIQVALLNISYKQEDYLLTVANKLKTQGIRLITDTRNEKIGLKIREHSVKRYPYLVIIGDDELINKVVSVRQRGGNNLGQMTINQLVKILDN